MSQNRSEWVEAKERLVSTVMSIGFPAELGEQIARELGSPKAMGRMVSYLQTVRPKSAELVVDEMLAIKSEIEAWRDKKASEEANARLNEIMRSGVF